jgi:hypothetical protein
VLLLSGLAGDDIAPLGAELHPGVGVGPQVQQPPRRAGSTRVSSDHHKALAIAQVLHRGRAPTATSPSERLQQQHGLTADTPEYAPAGEPVHRDRERGLPETHATTLTAPSLTHAADTAKVER